MRSNSTKSRIHHTLVAPAPDRVLTYLANVPDTPPAGTVVTPRLIAGVATDYRFVNAVSKIRERYPTMFANCSESDVLWMRYLLRKAWTSPDPREKDWFIFLLRKFHADTSLLVHTFQENAEAMMRGWESRNENVLSSLQRSKQRAETLYHVMDGDLIEQARAALRDGAPPDSEFEKVALYLQRNSRRALFCPNPECANPYFFSNKRGQSYCSHRCAQYGQRESKKKWWQENRAKPKRRK